MNVTWFTWAWVLWILFFLVVEGIAVSNNIKGDTLSEHVWWLIGTGSERSGWNWFFRVFLAGLIAWLIPHFMTGWKWFKRSK
jgi:hypothetical protein